MKIFFLFIFINLLICCNSNTKSSTNQSNADSLITTLIGKWGGPGEDGPVFEIRKDSIYYFERSTAYSYKIINHDMVIDLPESKGILKNIHVFKDTLYFVNDELITRAIKFKNK